MTMLASLIAAAWLLLAPHLSPDAPPAAEPGTDDDAPGVVSPDPERTGEANVLEVLDGDSLLLLFEGQIYRFEVLGADAPEWVERAETPSDESVDAKRFLTRMLYGERVRVFEPVPGATDAIGRRRGYIFREPDGLFVDLEIVRQGYGKVSTRASDPYLRVLRWYEQRARELSRGVWGRPEEPQPRAEPQQESEQVAAPEPEQASEPQEEAQERTTEEWVWVTRSGSKFHRESCQHAGSASTRVLRKDAEKTHEPCRVCRPTEG